jgi:hypothetical protein
MKTFQQKLLCLIGLILISGLVYSQYGPVRFNYDSELEKRLFPKIDTATTKEIVLFCERPSFDNPEQSLRIVVIGNQTFIEARILERNLWNELNRIKPSDSLSVETCFFSAPISNSFRAKMLEIFSKVIVLHKSTIKPKRVIKKTVEYKKGKWVTVEEKEGPDFFDGTLYLFRTNDNGNMSNTTIACPLGSDDFRYQVSMANLQIINDIKNNLFVETKYDVYK